MWCASLDSPYPNNRGPSPSRSSSAKAAASPMLMPERCRVERPAGLAPTPAASELKPNNTLPHSESTPPTTTASATPSSSSRAPCAKALALEEQAVATVTPTLLQTQHASAGTRRWNAACAPPGSAGPREIRRPASGVCRPLRWRRCWRWTCRAPARRAPRHNGPRRRDRLQEAIPLQAHPREAVVAAFVAREVPPGSGASSMPATRPDPGSQWLTAEVVGSAGRSARRRARAAARRGRRPRRRWP